MQNSFFGEVQAPQDGSFDSSAPVLSPIPAKEVVKAIIEESKWDNYTPQASNDVPYPETQTFIKNTWTVIEGEYQGRKIINKVHVQDADPEKRKRALCMLAAMDANAGGKIMASGAVPDDMMLGISLCNVPMLITVEVYTTNNGKEGNWVSAVARVPQQAPQQQVPQQAPQYAPQQAPQQQTPQHNQQQGAQQQGATQQQQAPQQGNQQQQAPNYAPQQQAPNYAPQQAPALNGEEVPF